MIPEKLQVYVGRRFTFPDGNNIFIREIKRRDEYQYWITYETTTGPGIPQKYIMEFNEFKATYGHLFP
jgi:hypothetical protein